MLAQNFKTPADLAIGDAEFEALVKVLGMLERGEIEQEQFDMGTTGESECNTPACMCGHAWKLNRDVFPIFDLPEYPLGIRVLFGMYLTSSECKNNIISKMFAATPAKAAMALRNYLTTGEPRWHEVLAE